MFNYTGYVILDRIGWFGVQALERAEEGVRDFADKYLSGNTEFVVCSRPLRKGVNFKIETTDLENFTMEYEEEGLKIVATEVLTAEYLEEISKYILHKINYKKESDLWCHVQHYHSQPLTYLEYLKESGWLFKMNREYKEREKGEKLTDAEIEELFKVFD